MSKIYELIEQLCPNGVPFKRLNEISEMKRGTSITKKDIVEGDIPVISGGRIPAYYCNSYNRDGETITVAGSGAGAGYVQYWNQPVFVCDAFSIKGKGYVTTKYLYYCLSNMQEYIYSTKKGGGVPHVHISNIENVMLPVPPLEIQREIVHILDSFTVLTEELEANLSAELTARKKQYEFYRNKMLTFKTKITRKKLGELFDFRNGLSKGKEYFGRGIPFISYTDVYKHRALRKEDITALVECTPAEAEKLRVLRGDGRFAAIDGRGYARPCIAKNKGAVLRILKTSYFRTGYKGISVTMALLSEI